jgi:tRNA G10  N-methylase Trm11
MKYLFILGRNPELSIAEILAFLKRKHIPISKSEIHKNSILIDISTKLPDNTIDQLGGSLAIGEVLTDKINDLDKEELYSGTKNKFNYVVWNFSEETEKLSDYLRKRFKQEKLKSTEKRFGSFIKLQNGKNMPNISSKTVSQQFFAFNQFFGKIIQTCDYQELEKRDMEKPVRRGKLAISPKISKIMINLSLIENNQTLLDPFCGIGALLQEALLQDLKVIGIDIDKNAIRGANQNLEWGNFSTRRYTLMRKDSQRVKIQRVNVLVAEPDLGEILQTVEDKKRKIIVRKSYSRSKAIERMRKFEDLMINVLNNLQDNVSGRIVFTSPFIKCFDHKKERIGCNIDIILQRTNLKQVEGFPINDFRQDQVTGRQIFVLEK